MKTIIIIAESTITTSFYYLATPMLIMRDSMLEVTGSDFIELAQAKGLSPTRVMMKHFDVHLLKQPCAYGTALCRVGCAVLFLQTFQ